MKLEEYGNYDGLGLAGLVAKGEVTPAEVTACALEAIERLNPRINAVIEVFEDRKAPAPQDLADGRFKGVPFLIKDLVIHEAGRLCEMGSRLTKGNVAPHDADLMVRFRDAGVNNLGRTTSPELGFSCNTVSLANGSTRGPWNLERTAGGSSGGSCAAVAAGMVPIAHADDGGGSIRIPASVNGLVGLKPTRGRTPMGPDVADGLNGLGIEFAVSRTVRDSAAMMDAVEGPGIGDPYVIARPGRPYLDEVTTNPGKLRIAVSANPPSGVPVDAAVRLAFDATVALCGELGHEILEAEPAIDYPLFRQTNLTVWTTSTAVWIGEAAAASARTPSLDNLESTTLACYEAGMKVSAADLQRALGAFNLFNRAVGNFFEEYDVLLTPTTAQLAWKLGAMDSNTPGLDAAAWYDHIFSFCPFTALFNVTGNPAISLPLSMSDGGLPIGMQFVGRYGAERSR
ncbi:MAG: amidase [Alphaproteobacteria bacterium]|jgi:amidase|nr:amidase [Alphaproteobacteria bacterium]